jgi:hypothetical protein
LEFSFLFLLCRKTLLFVGTILGDSYKAAGERLMKKINKRLIVFSTVCFLIIISLVFFGYYFYKISKINDEYNYKYNNSETTTLRKFPFPYQAALTICSDIDQTNTAEEFIKIQKFLNTRDTTSMGKGVGLEIGNSFFMFHPDAKFAYFSGRKKDQEVISDYINTGIIDSLHSYGDKRDFTRQDAVRSISELNKLDRKIDVWIDHSYTIDNISASMGGMADIKASHVYHADLTRQYGFKFFWLNRVTSVLGQERPISLDMFTGIFDPNHKIDSSINMLKEFSKHVLAVFGNDKYAMQKDYRLVRVHTLRDGNKVFEFIRYANFWSGICEGADSKGLAYVLSNINLEHLIENNGYMIVYTHLGKNSDCKDVIAEDTQEALRNLALEYNRGNIYVASTSKLLNYYVTRKYLKWKYEKSVSGAFLIHISGVYDPLVSKMSIPNHEQLQGITFYVPDTEKTRVYIGEKEIMGLKKNPTDYTGRKSVMFPIKVNFKN